MARVPKRKDSIDDAHSRQDRITGLQRQHRYFEPETYYAYEKEISLIDLWRSVVRYKQLIAAITLASALMAALAAFLMTPVYRAEILLSPVQQEKRADISSLVSQLGGLDELAGINLGGGGNNTLEAIAILESRALTTAFIKEENLMPVLFAKKWDAEKKQWKTGIEIPTEWDAYQRFDGSVRSVNLNSRSGLVTLAIEWTDPDIAAHWANQLVRRVNAERRAEAIREAETSINYLKQQLAVTSSVEIQQAIYRLIEAQAKTIMVANARSEYTFKVIDAAVAPQEKIRPKTQWMIIQGLLAGLIIALFVVFVRSSLAAARPVNKLS
ncbi:MAG TPA: Wzz/FepE/Etk N-terminal domain-containing protein [Gammaproteobacteria bacterium]